MFLLIKLYFVSICVHMFNGEIYWWVLYAATIIHM